MTQLWRGPAKNRDGHEVTFIVSLDPNNPEMHVETATGEPACRLGKGAYFFNGKQYEAYDPSAA
jgi:hypothetical protein